MEKVLKDVSDLITSRSLGSNGMELVEGSSIKFDRQDTNGFIFKREAKISLSNYDVSKKTDKEKKIKFNNLYILKGVDDKDTLIYSMYGTNKPEEIVDWIKDKLETQTYDEEILDLAKTVKKEVEKTNAKYLFNNRKNFFISQEIENIKDHFKFRSVSVRINDILTENYLTFSIKRFLNLPSTPLLLTKSLIDVTNNTRVDRDFKIENVTSDLDSEIVMLGLEIIDKIRNKDTELADELEERINEI